MGKTRSLCRQENCILVSSQCKAIQIIQIITLNQVYFARQWLIELYSQNLHFLQKQDIYYSKRTSFGFGMLLVPGLLLSHTALVHVILECRFPRNCQEFCVLITWAFMGHECKSPRSPENLKLQSGTHENEKNISMFPICNAWLCAMTDSSLFLN